MNQHEPQPPLGDAPTWAAVPAELEGQTRAVAEWQRLAPMLRRGRQVTDADRAALIALCLEWGRYLDAQVKILAGGMVVLSPNNYPIMNPYLAIANRALAGCSKLWAELGLTPSSRTRVQVHPPDDADAFAEFDLPGPSSPPH